MKSIIAIILIGLLAFGCVSTTPPASAPEQQAPQVIDVPTEEPSPQVEETTPPETEPVAPETPPDEPEAAPEPEAETSPTDGMNSKEITFKTKDAWEIHATLYYADTDRPTTAIILLHGLGQDRHAYDSLVPRLHEEFSDMDILVMDMRGHGDSTNIGTLDDFITGDFITMKNDIPAAKDKISALRPSLEDYYLVGASMGSSAALKYAAGDSDMEKVVMLSPGLEYRGVDISDAALDYIGPLYMAAGYGDEYSRISADSIYSDSPSDEKELKIYYDTDAHGTELFSATANDEEPLVELVVSWLKK